MNVPALRQSTVLITATSGLAQLRRKRRRSSRTACCQSLEARRLLSFAPAVNYAVSTTPQSVVTADLDNDGKLDLATANSAGGNISLRIGNGAGGFGAVSHFTTGAGPLSLAAGDFDNDGKLDLAALRFDGEIAWVSALRGRGDGTFQAPVHTAVWEEPLAMAAADFNGDGRTDLVYSFIDLLNWDHPAVAVLLSNGQGGFAVSLDHFNYVNGYANGARPLGLAVGDLNADGKVDVVTANDQAGTVSVLLGNGDGTLNYDWTHPRDFAAGQSPRAVAVGDLTGDGKSDLVVAGQTVSTLRGRGDGTFDAAISQPVSGSPHTAVATADFNDDGRRDAIVTDQATGTISALLGNGDGTLQAARTSATGSSPTSVAVADFNGDARPDVASANAGSNNVSVLINDGAWASKTFVGPGGAGSGGNWSNANNWSPSGVPAVSDLVTIAGKSVNVAASATVAGLTLTGGTRLTVAQNGGRALRTAGLTIDAASKLDLKDNDLIIDYAGLSPLGQRIGSAYTGVAGLIQSGRNGGAWDGSHGIITSMPGAAAGLTTIGIAEASGVLGITAGATETWNGHTVDATTLLLKYTYAGDANLDGVIDGGDYGIIDNFVQLPGASGYFNGDFNYDGVIDGGDYGAIDNNIQAQGPAL